MVSKYSEVFNFLPEKSNIEITNNVPTTIVDLLLLRLTIQLDSTAAILSHNNLFILIMNYLLKIVNKLFIKKECYAKII